MPRYYFDTRDGEELIRDEAGLDLPTVDAAKRAATVTLAALALDILPGTTRRKLSVTVRDHRDRLALVTELTFEVNLLD